MQHNISDKITFQISAPIYWGFQAKIEKIDIYNIPTNFERIAYICNIMKILMSSFFSHHNLLELSEGIDKLNLFIHDIPDILNTNEIVYVCAHGPNIDENHKNIEAKI